MRPHIIVLAFVGCALVSPALSRYARGFVLENGDDHTVLWQIGQKDGKTEGFALAPNGFSQYQKDPIFLVGVSDPARDWPYVQPGPADAWAGGRPHTATILFGLEAPPSEDCELVLCLANTHYRSPPRVVINGNGKVIFQTILPAGGPDATIMGDLAEAKPCELQITVPAGVLRAGTNVISITTQEGSWMLYDAVAFLAGKGVKMVPLSDVTAVRSVQAVPALVKSDGELRQVVELEIIRAGGPISLEVSCEGRPCWSGNLSNGTQEIIVPVPRVVERKEVNLVARASDKVILETKVPLAPVREWVVYLLPHSHVDIGYTDIQTKIEQNHWRFYEQALETAAKTADYPPEAQFKWNVEVLWAVDSYLRTSSPEKRAAFLEAVRKGVIGLQALYGNELTALCRPEELLRLLDYAQRLKEQIGVPIDSAMISDVPGYTWGIVTALAQAGVRYFSIGPNGGHRIGHTLRVWGDKAFWWRSPSGQERVLCWIPRLGYWRGFRGKSELFAYLRDLQESQYPFEMVQLRHCLGDNAAPDVGISDFVKNWNEKYAYPRLVIATCSEMMREFERRYGDNLPECTGDFTPYWEDGAASSARETGLVRRAADRLSSAETLWAMLQPDNYPDELFYQAWRNVVLYDEHTWGAYNSITEPDSEFAKSQWQIKQSFALEADRQSRDLLTQSLKGLVSQERTEAADRYVMVLNPTGWVRSDLVTLEAQVGSVSSIQDDAGAAVPWQKLSDGRLAFWAKDVPAFGARRFRLVVGGPGDASGGSGQGLTEGGTTMETQRYRLEVEPQTGALRRLVDKQLNRDLVDKAKGWGLAEYLYVPGRNPEKVERIAAGCTVKRLEEGPLVQRWAVESPAPGCRSVKWIYELSDVKDQIKVDMILDKEKVRSPEGVHVAFPFYVPDGQMRMELAWAIVRPEADQLPGACKNYYTVQRWIDVSNEEFGVLWGSWDAPLVELGTIRTDVPQPFSPEGWLTHIEPTQTILSYVMNNYWETNYKADQEGPTLFTYFILPHRGGYDPVAATRFGIETTRPLIALVVNRNTPPELLPPVRVESGSVLPVECKMTRDGRGMILRLFNPRQTREEAVVKLDEKKLTKAWITDLSEKPGAPVTGPVTVAGFGLVSLRLE
ncbi:polysaccharide lyase family protein [Thermogutta sp.]|uniref:polysaccharide lyase family protein n=1 Tax=Thermogutta sp. TaxID=1962930 RepID=UPI003C7EBA38